MPDSRNMLDLAARLALRAAGDVEPNPMVGAAIVRDGVVIGLGHHRRFGGLHAEREALADCRRRGHDPRGATVFVTLEPCCHHGKQPPCTDALIEAGVARVVFARPDPHETSGGGASILRAAGIACEGASDSALAVRIGDPFVKRVTTGLPWVVAKWAQSHDGRLGSRPGVPRWISCEASRRRVHCLRARVDAIVTGIGTVVTDDPMLTARGVRVHRMARRVVIDARLETPLGCALVRTAREVPTTIVTAGEPEAATRRVMESAGVEVTVVGGSERVDLLATMRLLVERYGATTVLLEAGPRLLASMLEEGLVDVVLTHTAPPNGADDAPLMQAEACLRGMIGDAGRLALVRTKRVGVDLERWYCAVRS
ncbi:MAG: bifunctional diaminohydroxyphosphoribosylaminopyrimidine deaminase/5-amino-6-(5-phosphoribosylamino)uracil reductase RibD [Leptolyngbya sp. PLA2]|nr:bifunctional diaminohydroxyphosphoribosylaminopyrimidine deaminase/5-amino-6-(5-phosphoribosylamino)uracil reductase RibD [Leptolyngbya sp. PL-A2]MCQ3940132.1 bifunctional diaminohydroxyphosphoribosylaminopyrimidine deaminase/5-amino-6-(5-phosphoribosylamino)uracil reductase RibD [cyanobacterium CYA1]MCZ7632746.1 bifunctional diaminohydroxyphosphoribosylaminopyrimidine deaminase/5-amino-6-(5-phosphoribosylamino)uracil reductase RibD [Phycisphaerales bacterium]MDL1904131.1 bifunctional diamino